MFPNRPRRRHRTTGGRKTKELPTRCGLANRYQAQQRYREAERLLLQNRKIAEQAGGRQGPLYAESLNALAELYEAQGRPTEAEPLRIQSEEIMKTTRDQAPDAWPQDGQVMGD